MSSVVSEQPKLDILASTRLPSDWNDVIENRSSNRSNWIREAVKQRLMAENLIGSSESQFSHEYECIPTYTLNTLSTSKDTNVFGVIGRFLTKQLTQKKTDGRRSFSAHSSQG